MMGPGAGRVSSAFRIADRSQWFRLTMVQLKPWVLLQAHWVLVEFSMTSQLGCLFHAVHQVNSAAAKNECVATLCNHGSNCLT